MKPHFIGIGGERCGTSWVYSCLAEHPQLCMPFKTVNFFHRDDNFRRGLEWYEGHFKACSGDKLVGEITTAYLYSAEAAKRICEYHPTVQLFVSLRNPVDRALSHYQNEMMGGIIDSAMTFEEAVQARPLILERSLYSQGLRRYLHHVRREQVLILVYEDAQTDPVGFLRQIFQFLAVDPEFRPAMTHRRVNEGGVPRSARLDRALMLMKKTGVTGSIRRSNIRSRAQPLTQAQRGTLLERFAADIREVEALLQRDLSVWRK